MRTWLIAFVILLLAGCKGGSPAVTLELHDGNVLQSSAWQGKWVYINYWAEWCKPCKEEIPALNEFARNNPDVLVLGVNFDKAQDVSLLSQINRFRIEYGVVTNDIQPAFPHALPQGLPSTIVFDPDGKLVQTLDGPQTVETLAAAKQR